jgi:polar amino acid transport system substrate-binding protein
MLESPTVLTAARSRWLPLLLAALALSSTARAEVQLPLLTYYDYGPFMQPGLQDGLTHQLAGWMNKHLAGRYRVLPAYLPKGRVDRLLQDPDWAGALVWIDPGFVGDAAQRRYHWSVSLLEEGDYVVWRSSDRFEYRGPESLLGRSLGTVAYQRYPGLEDWMQQGRIRREDAPSQEAALRKLLLGRVDTVLLAASTLAELRAVLPDLDRQIHLSTQPYRRISRRLMLGPGVPAAQRAELLALVQRMDCDADWQAVLKQHGLVHQRSPSRCR